MGMFTKATKHEAKLRLAIAGPSGSGKTYSALAIATGLGGPIAFVDTEHGSASKYADLYSFDVLELHAPYHPDKYIEAIQGAAQAGYNVVILDSISHAWNGAGGLLELVEQVSKRMKTPNSYTAWGDVTPIQNRFIEAIVSANIHVIATMRSKQEYVQDKDERTGRTIISKKGMAPIQRDSMEYEFDIFLEMNMDNEGIVGKTRCPEMTGKVYSKPGKQVADILAKWLGGEPLPISGDVLFAKPEPPTDEELEILGNWHTPKEAQAWAVTEKYCKNEHHARESFEQSVVVHGGKLNKENIAPVYLHFLRHQLNKRQPA